MTDCPNGDIRDLLPDFLHDRLSPDLRGDVEAHLRACSACQQELALLRDVRAMMHVVPVPRAGDISSAVHPYRRRAGAGWHGWRAAAAVALLVAGAGTVATVRSARQVAAPNGSVVSITPPGSQVALVDVGSPSAAAASQDSVAAPGRSASRQASAPRELAMANTVITELDDRELSALLDQLESLDAVPSVDVEAVTSTPVPPDSMNE